MKRKILSNILTLASIFNSGIIKNNVLAKDEHETFKLVEKLDLNLSEEQKYKNAKNEFISEMESNLSDTIFHLRLINIKDKVVYLKCFGKYISKLPSNTTWIIPCSDGGLESVKSDNALLGCDFYCNLNNMDNSCKEWVNYLVEDIEKKLINDDELTLKVCNNRLNHRKTFGELLNKWGKTKEYEERIFEIRNKYVAELNNCITRQIKRYRGCSEHLLDKLNDANIDEKAQMRILYGPIDDFAWSSAHHRFIDIMNNNFDENISYLTVKKIENKTVFIEVNETLDTKFDNIFVRSFTFNIDDMDNICRNLSNNLTNELEKFAIKKNNAPMDWSCIHPYQTVRDLLEFWAQNGYYEEMMSKIKNKNFIKLKDQIINEIEKYKNVDLNKK